METKDLHQELVNSISFPNEDQFSDDTERVMWMTDTLLDYFNELGIKNSDIFSPLTYLMINRLLNHSKDLEAGRQEIINFLRMGLENEIELRENEDSSAQPDFFSVIQTPCNKSIQ
jgi:hypothetical protein